MIFIIALLLALALTLLCGPALRRCPGAFYTGAAIVSGIFGAEDIEETTRRLAEVMRGNLGDCVAGRR